MAGVVAGTRKMLKQVDLAVEEVRTLPWAQPLAEGLETSARIVEGLGGFLPGVSLIGEALALGAELLCPQPSNLDLEEKLVENKKEIKNGLEEVKESLHDITKVTAVLQYKVRDTFHVVVDQRYRDGVETVDAAFEVFLGSSFEDFQPFVFELQTTATKSLSPQRLKEYLTIISKELGLAVCQAVMEYVILVLGKYLQMMVVYHISKKEVELVTSQFDQFNDHFFKLNEVFKEVTGQDFVPGQDLEENLSEEDTKLEHVEANLDLEPDNVSIVTSEVLQMVEETEKQTTQFVFCGRLTIPVVLTLVFLGLSLTYVLAFGRAPTLPCLDISTSLGGTYTSGDLFGWSTVTLTQTGAGTFTWTNEPGIGHHISTSVSPYGAVLNLYFFVECPLFLS